MKKLKIFAVILVVISVISLSCVSVYAEDIIPQEESTVPEESLPTIEESLPPIEESPPPKEDIAPDDSSSSDSEVVEIPNIENPTDVLEIPNDLTTMLPEETLTDTNVLSELTKIRIALEILVYGAFPVCVAVFLLTKFLLCFKRYFT